MPTICPIGSKGRRGPQLITPYTLDTNDMRFATPQGFNSGDQFYAYLKDSFDTLYAEGDVAPKMLSVGLHCRLVGRPGRAASLARFIDYVLSHDRAWSQPASTSHATGLASIRRRADGSLRASRGRCSSSASAESTNTRHGSPWSPTTRGSQRKQIRPEASRRRWRRRPRRDPRIETRADPRPPRPRRQARACQVADARIDARTGERRARPAEPRTNS